MRLLIGILLAASPATCAWGQQLLDERFARTRPCTQQELQEMGKAIQGGLPLPKCSIPKAVPAELPRKPSSKDTRFVWRPSPSVGEASLEAPPVVSDPLQQGRQIAAQIESQRAKAGSVRRIQDIGVWWGGLSNAYASGERLREALEARRARAAEALEGQPGRSIVIATHKEANGGGWQGSFSGLVTWVGREQSYKNLQVGEANSEAEAIEQALAPQVYDGDYTPIGGAVFTNVGGRIVERGFKAGELASFNQQAKEKAAKRDASEKGSDGKVRDVASGGGSAAEHLSERALDRPGVGAERAKQEGAQREKAAQEKADREKAAQEKADREKAAQEKADREKAEREKKKKEEEDDDDFQLILRKNSGTGRPPNDDNVPWNSCPVCVSDPARAEREIDYSLQFLREIRDSKASVFVGTKDTLDPVALEQFRDRLQQDRAGPNR